MPADPQHPDIAALVERLRRRASRIRAIGFVNDESASDADLAADNLEALARPQHPDIAALAERIERRIEWYEATPLVGLADPDHHLLCDALAALRTVARPVEDEEVGPLLTRAKIELAWDDPAVRSAVRIPGKMTPDEKPFPKWLAGKMCDALARLAREKASAEQERDAALARMAGELEDANAQAAKDRKLAAAWLCDKLKAQTDLAVAREALAEIEVELGGSLHRAGIREIARRALAAAAGAEEPR